MTTEPATRATTPAPLPHDAYMDAVSGALDAIGCEFENHAYFTTAIDRLLDGVFQFDKGVIDTEEWPDGVSLHWSQHTGWWLGIRGRGVYGFAAGTYAHPQAVALEAAAILLAGPDAPRPPAGAAWDRAPELEAAVRAWEEAEPDAGVNQPTNPPSGGAAASAGGREAADRGDADPVRLRRAVADAARRGRALAAAHEAYEKLASVAGRLEFDRGEDALPQTQEAWIAFITSVREEIKGLVAPWDLATHRDLDLSRPDSVSSRVRQAAEAAAKILERWAQESDRIDAEMRLPGPAPIGEVILADGIRCPVTTAHVRALLAERTDARERAQTAEAKVIFTARVIDSLDSPTWNDVMDAWHKVENEAERRERMSPTLIEIVSANEAAGTARVVVVGWHVDRAVTVPLSVLTCATGLDAGELVTARWLEASVNVRALAAEDLRFEEITLTPPLPPGFMGVPADPEPAAAPAPGPATEENRPEMSPGPDCESEAADTPPRLRLPCLDQAAANALAEHLRGEGLDGAEIDESCVTIATDSPGFAWELGQIAADRGWAEDGAVAAAVSRFLEGPNGLVTRQRARERATGGSR